MSWAAGLAVGVAVGVALSVAVAALVAALREGRRRHPRGQVDDLDGLMEHRADQSRPAHRRHGS